MEPDRYFLEVCKVPTKLPKRDLTQQEVERLWITDRKSLVDCGKRHSGLAAYITQRDNLLRTKNK